MSSLHRTALGVAAGALVFGVASAPAATTKTLKASLSGAKETPQKGDPDGSGRATVRITGTRLCYSLSLSKVATTAGHIHRGRTGSAGAIVVPLYAGAEDRSGCVTVKAALAREIAKTPSAFYFNVHNAAFPAGAMRGQLAKG